MRASFDIEVQGFKSWVGDLLTDVDRELQPKVIRSVIREATDRLIKRTPRKSGRAASGWVGIAYIGGKTETVRGRKFRLEEETPLNAGSFRVGTDARRLVSGVVVNGVPYIMRLEFGWSNQAPNGMIRITFQELQSEQIFSHTLQEELRRSVARTNQRHAGRASRSLAGVR